MKLPLLRSLLVTAVLVVANTPQAQAAFVFTLTEVGGDVDVLGTGTINTTDLTPAGAFSVGSFMDPDIALMTVGAFATNNGFHYAGATGPSDFGTGGFNSATTALGDLVGIESPDGYVDVPNNYVSGTPLADSAAYASQTFDNLGLATGTYIYNWGTGTNADSLTVNVVPEPSTWAMLLGGAGMFLAFLCGRLRQSY